MSFECRDWLKTLWAASFKGVPFYFESDDEEGGRDNVKHVFPNRDDPFIEDLGEALRFYGGTAYVHGDNADSLAAALKSVLASRGPGTLVVPYFGPVTVHCETFKRSTQLDKMGYVAFELKFVRAGASSALISVPFLQNQAFGAAETAANLIGQLFPQQVTVDRTQPDYVVSGAIDTLASGAAAVDVMRQQYPVDPAVSAKLRDGIATFIATVPDAIAGDPGGVAATLIALVRQFADALPAVSAVRATVELAGAFEDATAPRAKAYISPIAQLTADNIAAATRMVRLAAVTAYAESVLRMTFTSRPDGVTARGEVAERFENELYNTTGAALAPLYVAVEALRGRVIEWLTQTINNLAPVITVESARIRPSLDLAWILYADPLRADELVARNNVRHPSFMPRTISALSR
jgi:prophage DNA circulation protein